MHKDSKKHETPTDANNVLAVVFSVEDMLGFAHYLRNGLTNLEYCLKEHEEHLADWIKNYR